MPRHTRSIATTLALGAALLAAPVRAQTTSSLAANDTTARPAPAAPAAPAPAADAAPAREALIAGARRPASGESARVLAHAAERPTRAQSRALALVGAAAFVTGIILGDDIGTLFMVGGAGVGLYGLYYWLQ